MNKKELVRYLDEYLNISEFNDKSKNGLQVDTSREEIKKIGYSVDSTSYIFDRAIEEDVDMVLAHHGIFWGFEEVLTGVPYQRIKKLMGGDIGLYASHLPLDAHSEVGNNMGLAKAFVRMFGFQEGEYEIEKFCEYHGNYIGYGVRFNKEMHISNIVVPYAERMQLLKRLYNFGDKEFIKSVAFVSGGAGSEYKEASNLWYDVYVTGEASHSDLCAAKELGQSILIGGHRETEKIGVKLLAYHLKEKFGLEVVFLDEKY